MTALRITGGTLRGRRIAIPKNDVRPTSEKARQAFFNIIGEQIHDARFLDLFDGSGIFAFEAISRGAKLAVSVDSARSHTVAIDRMAKELAVPIKTITADALAGIKRLHGEVFDVIYADPPYAYEHYDEVLAALPRELTLGEGGVIAFEHDGIEEFGMLGGSCRPAPGPARRLRRNMDQFFHEMRSHGREDHH